MEISPIKRIDRSKKSYRCDWCGELIEKGSSYVSWFTYGENITARCHPECYEAMLKTNSYDEEMPSVGTFRRGCSCGEKMELCRCALEISLNPTEEGMTNIIKYSMSADNFGDGKSVCLWRSEAATSRKIARFQNDQAALLFAQEFGFPLSNKLRERLGAK
jgi:hypothetical protein